MRTSRIVKNCIRILQRDFSSHYRGPDIQKSLPYFQPNTSVLKIIEESLKRNEDHLALIDGDTGESANFSQLLQQSTRLAAGLQQDGVTQGDVVAFCCDKSVLAYSLLLGVMFTGATAVLIPTPHADTIFELTPGHYVKALFYESIFKDAVTQSLSVMTTAPSVMGAIDSADPTITSFLNSTREFRMFQVDDIKEHVPLVLFSSGVSSHHKGIQISDLGAQLAGVCFYRKRKSMLYTLPLCWYSSVCMFLSSIFYRYPVVITNTVHLSERLQLIEKYKVKTFSCNMANLIEIFDGTILYENYDTSSVTGVLLGGEPVMPSVTRQFFTRVLGGRGSILAVFSCTGAGLLSSEQVLIAEDIELGMAGKPFPGVEIKILDDSGRIVQTGVVGTIWVKTLAAKGYWGSDDLNRNFLDEEGFYNTGDAGFFDNGGNLYLRGRVSDFINFRGIKFSHTNLEDLLMSHHAVQDVAVVGKPHPDDIQHATAFVVLRPEYKGAVTDRDIAAFVDERVEDRLRLRGGVNFRKKLPRLSSGKIIRKVLKVI